MPRLLYNWETHTSIVVIKEKFYFVSDENFAENSAVLNSILIL